VLANEDALQPGEYPVRLQVVGPNVTRLLERTVNVKIPERTNRPEPPFAMPVFAEDLVIDGPAGEYRFLATFERGAAPTGGEARFHVDVADPSEMPQVSSEVILWGQDTELAKWLADRGIRTRPFAGGDMTAREIILASGKPAQSDQVQAFTDLARRIARGSTAIFLSPETLARGDQPTGWVPLKNKGSLARMPRWLYHADDWAKRHPFFEGLPCGGHMDYAFYRELIPDAVWSGQDPPAEAVAGAVNAAQGYASGLLVAVHTLGAGRFILNTLRIRENLGRHPAAERLLRNMVRAAARDAKGPPGDLAPDFDAQLETLRYR